jgi:hypothetical protein
MKDFWDVAFILSQFSIPENELRAALTATFKQRRTPRPKEPIVFSQAFVSSERALSLWSAFLRRTHLPEMTWEQALQIIRDRIAPLYEDMGEK